MRLSSVLAEAEGVPESKALEAQAEAQAQRMRGVRHDWAGRPCVTWSVAAEVLDSLRAERMRAAAEHEERLVAAAAASLAAVPKGVPWDAVPVGVDPGQWLMLSDPDMQRSRRRSVVEDALAHAGTVFTPIRDEQAGQ